MADWFCPAYHVPDDTKQAIHEWAQQQQWPEGTTLNDPSKYHITGLYSPVGYGDPSHHDWVRQHSGGNYPAHIAGLDTFTASPGKQGAPVVLRVHSPALQAHGENLMNEAEARGLQVSRFPGGYKPHITVAYSPQDMAVPHPNLSFNAGPLFELHNYYDALKRQSNILDPIHDALDPLVWEEPESDRPRLRPVHREWIRRSIRTVLEDNGYTDVDDWLTLVLTGSLTTYQYSDESDCDISLFVDTAQLPEFQRGHMIGVMVEHLDGVTLPGTPHPMQNFVVPQGIRPHNLYQHGLRSGYDLQDDEWIIAPERDRVHDVEHEENGSYAYALEVADKMDNLLKYEPDKAVMFWHQIHGRRRRDQQLGKGDFAESNIAYKMLSNRGLFPRLSEASGEYIARRGAQRGSSSTGGRTSPLRCEACRVQNWNLQSQSPSQLDRGDGMPEQRSSGRIRSADSGLHIPISEWQFADVSEQPEQPSSPPRSARTKPGRTSPASTSGRQIDNPDSNSGVHPEPTSERRTDLRASLPRTSDISSYPLCVDCGKKIVFPKIADASGEYIAKTAKETPWSRVARIIEGDAMHDLLGHKKLQSPEGQAFLKRLQDSYHNERSDPLMPWLAREYRKGRVYYWPPRAEEGDMYHPLWHFQPGAPQGMKAWENVPDHPTDGPGHALTLTPETVRHWADWYHSPNRRKVPLEQLKVQDMPGEVKDWEKQMALRAAQGEYMPHAQSGEVVHKYPDGWTVRRLPSETLPFEGWAMRGKPDPHSGHEAPICVGEPYYQRAVDNGDTMIYSLRDPQHMPHVTMELRPTQYREADEDDQRAHLEHKLDTHAVLRHAPEDLKQAIRDYGFNGGDGSLGGENVKSLYENLMSDLQTQRPIPEGARVEQIQGKGNSVPKPEYQEKLKDWFQTFPEETRPNWKYDYPDTITHIGQLGDFPGTYDHGYPDGVNPDTQDREYYGGGEDMGGYGPHGDYGLADPAESLKKRPIEYDETLQSLVRPKTHYEWQNEHEQGYDPDEGLALYKEAYKRGEVPELAKNLEDFGSHWQDKMDQHLWDWDAYEQYDEDNHPLRHPENFDGDEDWAKRGYEQELDPKTGEHLPYEDSYDNYTQAENKYDEARGNIEDHWRNEWPQLRATDHLYRLINPHYSYQSQQYEPTLQSEPDADYYHPFRSEAPRGAFLDSQKPQQPQPQTPPTQPEEGWNL